MKKDLSPTKRERIVSFFVRQQKYGRYTTKFLSRCYPINDKLLETYEDFWDFFHISLNESISPDDRLLLKYQDKLDWFWVIRNKGIHKSEAVLLSMYGKFSSFELGEAPNVEFSVAVFTKYKSNIDGRKLCKNESFVLTKENYDGFGRFLPIEYCISDCNLKNFEELVSSTKIEWDWESLSYHQTIDFTVELIDKYIDNWDWEILSGNSNLPLTEEFILHYIDHWNWDNLSDNPALPLTEELIIRHIDRWNWFYLCKNPSLPITDEFIEKFDKYINWKGLCQNTSLPLSAEFVRKYLKKIKFKSLSWNKGGLIDDEIIEIGRNRWDWRELALNKTIKLTPRMVDLFLEKGSADMKELTENPNFPKIPNLLKRAKEAIEPRYDFGLWLSQSHLTITEKNFSYLFKELKWRSDWEILCRNKDVDFTFDILEKYEDYWNFDFMASNTTLYSKIFEEDKDDELLIEIIETLNKEHDEMLKDVGNMTVEEREMECIKRSLQYKKLENTRKGCKRNFRVKKSDKGPNEKSFVKFWEKYGIMGSGYCNRVDTNLTLDEMEEFIHFCFEVLYSKDRKELYQYMHEREMNRRNQKETGSQFSKEHPILGLHKIIQERFGNYG